MRKILIITCISCLIISIFAIAMCSKGSLEERVPEFKLSNGMKWFLVKRGYAPVFAGVLQVKVGGSDEVPGKTGLAHMLEHMAFKGTTSIGTTNFESEKEIMEKVDHLMSEGKREEATALIKDQKKHIVQNEIWDILNRNGAANINASTSKDVTTYHAEMPSSKVELWTYLLSRMISDPAFREFFVERDVVIEERRTSIENSPKGMLYNALLGVAFNKSPYSWATIGSKEDLSTLTRDDLKQFYKENYLPECMVGAIVGDIDLDQTKEWLEKYFGKLKGKGKVCHRELPIDPPMDQERRKTIEYDAEPMLILAYHKPTVPHFDDYIFDVYSYLLCEGESSRLVQSLVKEKRVAKNVVCFNSYPGTRLPNMFLVYAEPFGVDSLDELEKLIVDELNRLKEEPVGIDELARVKNQMKTSFLMDLDSNYDLARMLVYFENIAGDWRYVINHPDNIDKITFEDLMQAADKYFVPDNSAIIKLRRGDE